MLARFGGPLYVTDDYIPGIYTEIFNILILSGSPSEVQRQLLQLCSRKGHQNPYNYFKWGFSGSYFWLQQRLSYCSKECFAFKHLTIMTYSRINKLFINN